MNRFLRAVTKLSAGLAMLITASVAALPAKAETFDAAQRGEIEAIVKDYLLQNPEVVRDALVELDRRQKEAEESARKQTISQSSELLFNSSRQVVLGNPDGDVTLVEFFDYNCGYCKRAHADMERLIKEDGNLRVVLKEFPVLGQGSVEAAQVAVALSQIAPDLYEDFHSKLLLGRGQANGARAKAVALEVGADEDDLNAAIKSPEVAATIEEVYGLANNLGLTGTPSYVIGNDVVFGAVGYDRLKEKVTDARNCNSTSC